MDKRDILRLLCEDNMIVKISNDKRESNGEKTYADASFKIDKDLQIYCSTEALMTHDFLKREDITIEKLIEHILTLHKEGFKIEFTKLGGD